MGRRSSSVSISYPKFWYWFAHGMLGSDTLAQGSQLSLEIIEKRFMHPDREQQKVQFSAPDLRSQPPGRQGNFPLHE